MNGMVLGVHDVANGSADAAMRSEMEIIWIIAEELGSSTSGLTFEKVTSSTSDGAATQGKLNKLLQKEKESGDIVENLCSMHLGTNLRVAQVAGIQACNEAQLEEEGSQGTRRKNILWCWQCCECNCQINWWTWSSRILPGEKFFESF